jgi:hypothetical protein
MALEPGEVLGETIAQPASLNTLAARDAAATWVRRGKVRVNYGLPRGALNSAVECHLHTVEVAGSNPAAPTSNTNKTNNLKNYPGQQFSPVRHLYVIGEPGG